jgi:hypothetical protein
MSLSVLRLMRWCQAPLDSKIRECLREGQFQEGYERSCPGDNKEGAGVQGVRLRRAQNSPGIQGLSRFARELGLSRSALPSMPIDGKGEAAHTVKTHKFMRKR